MRSSRNTFRARYFQRLAAWRQRSGPSEHWTISYAKSNPIKVGSTMATVYGLTIIFGYHVHIEYFPVFDLRSLASLIFAAAYTAILVLVALSVGLFVPC
jgi:hypothetical protein